ncbi:MAG: hypothetical protein ACK4I8_10750 [Armatimonadota bacterium]
MVGVFVDALDILPLTFWHNQARRLWREFKDLSIKVSVNAFGVLKLMVGISVEAGELVGSTFARKLVLS